MKVLFICQANVGRSQMGAEFFKKYADGKHESFSAGTKVGERDGKVLGSYPGAANTLAVLEEKGIHAASNKTTQLTPAMVEEADKIIVMAEPETVPDYLSSNPKAERWEVPDLKDQSLEFTRKGRDEIEASVKKLLAALS